MPTTVQSIHGKLMRKFIDWLYLGLQGVLTFLIAILILPVTLQILARFTDIVPNYIWTEEMARFCLIWIIMIGASVAVRDGTHFDVCLLYTSDAADDLLCVDLGGRRIIKKKK